MLNPSHLTVYKLTDDLDNIIEGCVHGRRNDQEKLYRMFSSKMFGVCLRYCSNYDEAKDVLHDGFIKVFDKVGQYGRKGSFEGWIRRIMVNTALERFRKNPLVINLDQLPEIKEEEEESNEHPISMNQMLEFVQKLPVRYRMVFNLFVFEEMTHKEIAEKMGITEGTSKSDLSRARGILQREINNNVKKIANIG